MPVRVAEAYGRAAADALLVQQWQVDACNRELTDTNKRCHTFESCKIQRQAVVAALYILHRVDNDRPTNDVRQCEDVELLKRGARL